MQTFNLMRYKKDKKTQEETLVALNITKKQVQCLYKDRSGNYIINKQGFMYKVPYHIDKLEFLVE